MDRSIPNAETSCENSKAESFIDRVTDLLDNSPS